MALFSYLWLLILKPLSMKLLVFTLLLVPFIMLSCSGGGDGESTESGNDVDINKTTDSEVEVVEPPVNSYSIESEAVGIFELGREVPDPLPEELKQRRFIETDVNDEGKSIEHTHNVVFNMLEDVVELIMEKTTDKHHDDKHVEEIMVLSNYYQTQEGISVGSSIEQFREIYPDMTVWYDKIHDRYYVETEKLIGVQFIFNQLDVKRKAKGSTEHQQINKSYIKEGAKIERIRVH